jgi:hypothetical protein
MRLLFLGSLVIAALTACKTSEFGGGTDRAAALPPIQSRVFVQDTRETRQIQVRQGSSGSNGSENYSVTAMGIVDVVVVVDNSGSMAEEQDNLAPKLSALMSSIKDTDWRIVVTTTDPADRCGYGPISKGDFNADSRFRSFVKAGISGTGIERPMLRAVQALKGDCLFGPGKWLRPNSTVAVLILSDEDNCHIDVERGYGCDGQPDKDVSYLINYLSTIRKVGQDAKVYGIFWMPSQTQSQCPSALKQATFLADVVQKTGGIAGSICDSDYTATLSRISKDVAQVLKSDFVLRSMPDPGTLKITVNGQPWTAFTLVGTVVHFTSNPPVGAAVQVSYVSGASGVVTDRFAIPDQPADGVINATIAGKPAGSVSYDAAARAAVFSQRPADGSVILLTYKANTPLKSVFEIAPDADTRFLKVFVNNALIDAKAYKYDGKTGAISFAVPPPEAAQIRVDWRGSKKTS